LKGVKETEKTKNGEQPKKRAQINTEDLLKPRPKIEHNEKIFDQITRHNVQTKTLPR